MTMRWRIPGACTAKVVDAAPNRKRQATDPAPAAPRGLPCQSSGLPCGDVELEVALSRTLKAPSGVARHIWIGLRGVRCETERLPMRGDGADAEIRVGQRVRLKAQSPPPLFGKALCKPVGDESQDRHRGTCADAQPDVGLSQRQVDRLA